MASEEGEPCVEWAIILHGFVDGEVDAAHALAFEQHLAGCGRCRAALADVRAASHITRRSDVKWRAPDHVRAQILDALGAAARTRAAEPAASWMSAPRLLRAVRDWSFVPSAAALAASLFLVLSVPHQGPSLQDEILSSHVRSLLVDHLTDVKTSDQHTVKPWFNGKTDFSPPVVDLAAKGFPLVGGRIDYVAGRTVPVVIYRLRDHVINVFMWPSKEVAAIEYGQQGYTMLSWTADGVTYCAISDVAARDLATFKRDLQQAIHS